MTAVATPHAVWALRETGLTYREIGERLGINEQLAWITRQAHDEGCDFCSGCADCGYQPWPCPSCGIPVCNCDGVRVEVPKTLDDQRPLRWRKHHYGVSA